jgi:hypothetical protein
MADAATPLASAKPKRNAAPRKTGPRPAYVLVNLPEGVNPDDIEVVAITRHAEEALEAIDTGKAQKYLRVMVK